MPPGNVKTGLKESNLPPLNNDFESKVPQLFILDSRTFVAKSALSRLRAFWGALLAKIWWEGAQKHFKGPGKHHIFLSNSADFEWMIWVESGVSQNMDVLIHSFDTL